MKHIKILENFINEKNYQAVIGEGYVVNWTLNQGTTKDVMGKITALPSTSKDLDKLIDSNYSETEIGKDLENSINESLKKSRIGLAVKVDYGYKGAGYAFDLDLSEILKSLNK